MTLKNDNQPYLILQQIICNKKTVFMMLEKLLGIKLVVLNMKSKIIEFTDKIIFIMK